MRSVGGRPRTTLAAASVLLAGLLAACTSTPSPTRPQHSAFDPTQICGRGTAGPGAVRHVVWIWFENKRFDRIIGPTGSQARRESPFTNAVAEACGLATDYRSVTHPSLPNYLAAVSGSSAGITSDCSPADCGDLSEPSLFGELEQAGLDWRVFSDAMPSNCDMQTEGRYATKHNPALYFADAADDCQQWDLPLGTPRGGPLATALAADDLPAFSLVVPDLCNDTHDCDVAAGDAWLQTWLPQLAGGEAYTSGRTVVFITWDEGDHGSHAQHCLGRGGDESCHVATLVVAPRVAAGTTSQQPYSHYSLLRTTQELLGLPDLLGRAGDPASASMRAAFGL